MYLLLALVAAQILLRISSCGRSTYLAHPVRSDLSQRTRSLKATRGKLGSIAWRPAASRLHVRSRADRGPPRLPTWSTRPCGEPYARSVAMRDELATTLKWRASQRCSRRAG